jgi:hypothetical protein
MTLEPSNRVIHLDKTFNEDIAGQTFSNCLFVRLAAKEKRFTKVDFKYSIFDSCYLRKCVFDSCDFVGCRFINSNLDGSKFFGCKFDYALFEKTGVDNEILSEGCPGHENLKMRFARTLRMNYQQLGDAKSANKAIAVELRATEAHLHKAWNSNESYYRRKYSGYRRFQIFSEWTAFKMLDFVWGNGESVLKLLRAFVIALFLVAIIDALFHGRSQVDTYVQSIINTPQAFVGVSPSAPYPRVLAVILALLRFIFFGLLTAIIVKRFNRR